MDVQSKSSGHWTEEQLIAGLYGVGPSGSDRESRHLSECPQCREQLVHMKAVLERVRPLASENEVSFDLLAAQRRRIYARLAEPAPWWAGRLRRCAAAVAALLVFGAGVFRYEHDRHGPPPHSSISDAQLALDVSQMSQDTESNSTAPVQALFEE